MIDKAEFLDVLNENGIRTGEILARGEVHKRGLWHRAVACCIINSKNEVLLQQRSITRKKLPGLWDLSVASHVQNGEDAIMTLLREVNEEIGVQIEYKVRAKDFRFLTSFRNHHVAGDIIENQYYDFFILRKDVNIKELTFNDEEVQDIRWVNYTQLQKMVRDGVMHPRLEWVDEVLRYISRF